MGLGLALGKHEEGEGVMENENRAQECCMIEVGGWILCVEQCGWKLWQFVDVVFLNFWFTMPDFLMCAWGVCFFPQHPPPLHVF
jgi:hypothetical protein